MGINPYIDLIRTEAEKSNLTIIDGSVAETDDYDFEDHYCYGEIIDMIFKGFSNIGDISVLQNYNSYIYPIECNFSDLKDVLDELPMATFDSGNVVIIWKNKKIVTVFQHTGYYGHISELLLELSLYINSNLHRFIPT